MTVTADREPSWFGQPRGLTVLFLTETWEKFSFYGMRTLLVYYMTKQLMLGQAKASLIYGVYTACVYLTPIVGGVISDRWLGRRKSVIIGGTVMAIGHGLMTFEGAFYPALAVIALGNGLYLPSLPSQINGLYKPDDPRKGSAYNVYYVGINLGSFLAPLVCGALGEYFGWHVGFAAAGIGMVAGLVIYLAGSRYLPPEPPRATRGVAAAPMAGGWRERLLLLGGVAAAVVVFRGAYEQVGNTVALWAEGTDRVLAGGWTIPMTWFQSLNPFLVFAMTPLLVASWTRAAAAGREPSAIQKMSRGAVIVGAAFVLLAAISAWSAASGTKVGWPWLAAYFLVLTIGELYILPVGLGLFGRLAPAGLSATAIALWFFAAFFGNLLAGGLGVLWSLLPSWLYFLLMAVVACAAGLLLRVFDKAIRRVDAPIPSSAQGTAA